MTQEPQQSPEPIMDEPTPAAAPDADGQDTAAPETPPCLQAPEASPPRRKRHRSLLWALGILLALSLAVVLLLRALSFEAHWQNGRLVVTFFGAGSDYIAEAVTGGGQAPQEAAQPMPRAATGTGVTLALSQQPVQELSLQALYQAVNPATVSILVTTGSGSGSGSGILMTADGYVITNHHVIAGASAVTVQTAAGGSYEAALVGSDEFSDLAVLKIEAEGLPVATFASSAGLQVGDRVVAIGDPLGVELRGTMTDGIISAINRDIVVGDRTMTLLQTNAALNAGNSGGPLVNLRGQVIGINTMKVSSRYVSVEGLGFAIPMDVAKPLVDELIEKGYVAGRPALGITGKAVAAEASAFYAIPAGVYISSVEPNSDAARQGLREGDIITAIEGTEVRSIEELNVIKNDFRAGDTVQLTIWRDGETLQIGVQLIDRAQ